MADTATDNPAKQETGASPSAEGVAASGQPVADGLIDLLLHPPQLLVLPGMAAVGSLLIYQFVQDNKELVKAGINITRSKDAQNMLLRNYEPLFGSLDPVSKLRLVSALDTLSKTPEGKHLVEQFEKSGAEIKLTMSPRDNGGFFTPNQRFLDTGRVMTTPISIIAPGASPQGRLLAVLAHELRHFEQSRKQALTPLSTGKIVSPQENILHNRFVEADAQASATEIAFNLKQQGHPEMWDSIMSPQAGHQPAIAAAFENAVKADPAALKNGYARRAAFDAWFTAEYQPGLRVADSYNDVGLMSWPPDEATNRLRKNGAVLEPLNDADYKRIGQQESGVNYLDLPGTRPLNDPFYSATTFSPEQARMLERQNQAYDRLKNPAEPGISAPRDELIPPRRPIPKVRESQTEPVTTPAGRLAEMYIKTIAFTRAMPENIKIAASTPSALVTALPFVQKMRIDRALNTLGSVPEGAALVAAAKRGNTTISLDPHPLMRGADVDGVVDPLGSSSQKFANLVKLQGFANDGTLVALMAHELQHVRQAEAGLREEILKKVRTPEDAIVYERFMEADAQATTTEIAYKLKQAGKPQAWKSLQSAFTMAPEIAAAYEKMASEDPLSLSDGRAKRAAFDTWFTAKQQSTGVRLAEVYNDQALRNYPSQPVLETLVNRGAPVERITIDDMKKIGGLSDVNYLDIPGARPLTDRYYAEPNLNAASVKRFSAARDVFNQVAKRGEDASPPKFVRLQHGTSEGNLSRILKNGFDRPPMSPRESVRSAIEDYLSPSQVNDELITKVMDQKLRINIRSGESNNGLNLSTAPDETVAQLHARDNAPYGGEFSKDVFKALQNLGYKDIKPKFDGARPVMLTLDVPLENIPDVYRHNIKVAADGTAALDVHYEVVLNHSDGIKVAGVMFGDKDGVFDGQAPVSPEEAQRLIQPKFQAVPEAQAVDAATGDRRKILKEVYGLRKEEGIKVVEVRGLNEIERVPVAEAVLMQPDGSARTVHIPDPRFQSRGEKLESHGFAGITEKYRMPFDLTPKELQAYMDVLDFRESQGRITAEQKHTEIKRVLDEIESKNPDVKGLAFDRDNPAKVSEVMRGIVNLYSAENLQHHLSETRAPGYDDLKRDAQRKIGLATGIDIDLAPESLRGIQKEMDAKFADFERRTVAEKVEAPRQAEMKGAESSGVKDGNPYDRLPEPTRKIAALWRAEPVTDMPWKKIEDLGPAGLPDLSDAGHTRPFWVSAEFEGKTIYAVAKPLNRDNYVKSAAMERQSTGHETPVIDKIAFDVAYDVGVPVAPAALWKNEQGEKFVLSLKPFDSVETLDDITSTRHWSEREATLLKNLPAVSSASVFHIFAAQNDDHGRNILFDAKNPGSPPVFIDYDMAFQKEVATSGRPRTPGLADFFETPPKEWTNSDSILRAVDMDAAGGTAQKISNLDPNHVVDIVGRIPDDFLKQEQKTRVGEYFKYASETFNDRLEARFGGVFGDKRWPAVVVPSTRDQLPVDLVMAMPELEVSSRLVSIHPVSGTALTALPAVKPQEAPAPVVSAPAQEIKVTMASAGAQPQLTGEGGGSKFLSPDKKGTTGEVHVTSQAVNSGIKNGSAGAVGLVLSVQGLHDSYKAGDKWGMGIAGTNLATSTLQTTEGVLEAAGKTLPAIKGAGKFIPGVNIGVTLVDGVYQVAKEDTAQHKIERGVVVGATAVTGFAVGAATATVAEAGAVTAGATAVFGAGAVATGVAAVAVAAAPVVLTVAAVAAVAYVGNKAIEAKRAWDDAEKSIAQESRPQKLPSYKTQDGKPSVFGYKHIAVEMLRVSPDMRDENLKGKPARGKDGRISIDEIRKMDMHDPKNIAELERVLDMNIRKQEAILKETETWLPKWMDPREKVSRHMAAQMEDGDLIAAKKELEMYKNDLAEYNAAHPAAPAMPTAAASSGHKAPGSKPGG